MQTIPTIITELQGTVDTWVKTREGKYEKKMHKILDSYEYKVLPYAYRNLPFITSHKLLTYSLCPYFAHQMYNECVLPEGQDERYFKVGQAIDTLCTYGSKEYTARFMVKNRPSKELQEEADGKNQTILTESEGALIEEMYKEFASRSFFPKKLQKKNIVTIVNGLPLEAEIDHLDLERTIFGDLKSASSVFNFFQGGWRRYRIQMGFYFLCIIHSNMDMAEDLRRTLQGELYVVDKNSAFSRSHKFVFRPETLLDIQGEIDTLLTKWKQSQESGIWAFTLDLSNEDDLKVFFDSPLYPYLDSFKADIQPTYL